MKKILLVSHNFEEFEKHLINNISGDFSYIVYNANKETKNGLSLISNVNSDFKLWNILFVLFNYKKIQDFVKKINPDIILFESTNKIFVGIINFIIRNMSFKKFFFPYDISYFYHYKTIKEFLISRLNLYFEKKLFLNCDAIIHKGGEKELSYLPYYSKIKHKPNYLFREFINKDNVFYCNNINLRLPIKDNEFHLVYVGGIYDSDKKDTESTYNLINSICAQNLHLHLYSKVNSSIYDKLKQMEYENSYFHFHGYLDKINLISEISKYHYGIDLFGHSFKRNIYKSELFAFSNKEFDYMCALLPVIVSTNLVEKSKFVSDNQIGFSINYIHLSSLKNIIIKNHSNYKIYVNNILLKRKRFTNYIHLEQFLFARD